MRKIRARSITSIKPMAEAITTAANAAAGKCRSRFGAASSRSATASAPTTPVSCVRAPAASATGVRDELLLIGKSLKETRGEIGGPEPDHLLIGIDARAHAGGVGAGEDAGVGERYQGDGAAADQNRDDVGVADPRDSERREPLWQGTQHRYICARCQVQHTGDHGRTDHGNQDAGHALAVLEQQDHRQRACPDRKRRPVRSSVQDHLGDGPQISQRPIALDREAEKFGQLADQHRQRDSVHVAIADRLGKKLRHETQPRYACQDANNARDDSHHSGQGNSANGVSTRERQDDAENNRSQRRIWSQNQDATGAEYRICQQRHDSRVKTIDTRHARCGRIGDANGHQHVANTNPAMTSRGSHVAWYRRRVSIPATTVPSRLT